MRADAEKLASIGIEYSARSQRPLHTEQQWLRAMQERARIVVSPEDIRRLVAEVNEGRPRLSWRFPSVDWG